MVARLSLCMYFVCLPAYIFLLSICLCVYMQMSYQCVRLLSVFSVLSVCMIFCFCFFVTLSVCGVIAIMQVSMYLSAGVHICLSRYICLFHHAQGISSYGTLEVHMG